MHQAQSLLIMLALVALAFSPLVFMRARRRDAAPQPASPPPADPTTVEGILSPRQAVAHHLYGEAVGWQPHAMVDYDNSPLLQEFWLEEADRRL